ncbi:hypothetical protein [Aureimonas pseudogalii]|uniref:Uncharacterized protein n=1 Tax=Aureimonas pseudogalii TaxID=1744844 RepID=A0A7W6EFF4_9HYPH|nr:hypothetical protein [Aureimonas pseudogalii]MBB3997228.1 hypothetical protein [Aureimonas pseudogalii]
MTDAPYAPLCEVLARALEQAAQGKGADRHANGQPFTDQPILTISRMVGPGFAIGQVMKKAQEANTMARRGNSQNAVFELLGAINYLAAAVILIEEEWRA